MLKGAQEAPVDSGDRRRADPSDRFVRNPPEDQLLEETDTLTESSTESSSHRAAAPDAVGRGVLGHDPSAPAVLFVLAGHSLGTTPVDGEGSPRWFDLRRLVNLDAVGDVTASKVPVEAGFDGGPTLEALWPEPFCDQVIDRLRELLDSGRMIPEGAPDPPGEVPAGDAPATQPASDAQPASSWATQPASATRPTSAAQPASAGSTAQPAVRSLGEESLWSAPDDRPLPGDGPPLRRSDNADDRGELTLEDVVYHGGYPGETKRRKRCVAVLSGRGLDVSGPNGPDFSMGWESVRSVEAQNADEAKFRLGIKTKRNSSVIVLECDQDVSIILETRDVPTMPLKSALHELLDGGPVVVA